MDEWTLYEVDVWYHNPTRDGSRRYEGVVRVVARNVDEAKVWALRHAGAQARFEACRTAYAVDIIANPKEPAHA